VLVVDQADDGGDSAAATVRADLEAGTLGLTAGAAVAEAGLAVEAAGGTWDEPVDVDLGCDHRCSFVFIGLFGSVSRAAVT